MLTSPTFLTHCQLRALKTSVFLDRGTLRLVVGFSNVHCMVHTLAPCLASDTVEHAHKLADS